MAWAYEGGHGLGWRRRHMYLSGTDGRQCLDQVSAFVEAEQEEVGD